MSSLKWWKKIENQLRIDQVFCQSLKHLSCIICDNFAFLQLQLTTCLRYWCLHCNSFVGNLFRFPEEKECFKSVRFDKVITNVWQPTSRVQFFGHTILLMAEGQSRAITAPAALAASLAADYIQAGSTDEHQLHRIPTSLNFRTRLQLNSTSSAILLLVQPFTTTDFSRCAFCFPAPSV